MTPIRLSDPEAKVSTVFLGCQPDGKKLMVSGTLFGDFLVYDLKDYEVVDVLEQTVFGEEPFDERFHAPSRVGLNVKPADGFPGRIPFLVCRPHAMEARDSV